MGSREPDDPPNQYCDLGHFENAWPGVDYEEGEDMAIDCEDFKLSK